MCLGVYTGGGSTGGCPPCLNNRTACYCTVQYLHEHVCTVCLRVYPGGGSTGGCPPCPNSRTACYSTVPLTVLYSTILYCTVRVLYRTIALQYMAVCGGVAGGLHPGQASRSKSTPAQRKMRGYCTVQCRYRRYRPRTLYYRIMVMDMRKTHPSEIREIPY